ncbi:MAG TPA: BMP family ABC transporter substrate-binding protein [Pyrinomonadaceae bacterium]|jgi:basic membrane protein A and related proteins|nr:BMP family ABC transporter substrate-binding protein [Pyrinomonadaceae bacterium]
MKVKVAIALLVVTLLFIGGVACHRVSYSADDPHKIRVGIVFDIGGKDDRSFNAAAWNGVKCAESGTLPDGKTSCGKPALDVIVRDVEPGNPVSIEPAMRAFAERGYDLVIGVGFAQGPIMQAVAKDYPNIHFAIIDGVIFEDDGKTPKANVASLVFKEHEGSYLVGLIAGMTTKTNTIGFLGGMDIGLIHRFEGGYEQGAKSINPNIRVIQNYVGVTDAAWNNPGKGKEIALAQISKGADVIFTAAGNSGLGAFDAVEQAGKDSSGRATHFVIGVDSNQNMVKPGFVLTSMVKRVDNAVYDIVKDVVNHNFKGGFHVFGLDTEGVGYVVDNYNQSLVTPQTIQAAEDAKKKIVAGEIKVVDRMTQ